MSDIKRSSLNLRVWGFDFQTGRGSVTDPLPPFPRWGSTCCPLGSDSPLVSLYLSCPCDSALQMVSVTAPISHWNSSARGEISRLQMSATPLNVTPKRRGPFRLPSQPFAIFFASISFHIFRLFKTKREPHTCDFKQAYVSATTLLL